MIFQKLDPSAIDLKMAVDMSGHDLSWIDGDKGLSISSNYFPEIIDFDELEKIKPPKGYRVEVYTRRLIVETTSFRGMCPGAVHYYCQIQFHGPRLVRVSDGCCGFGPSWPKTGRIFGHRTLDVNRPVTAEDLADKYVDWTGYKIGDMTNRWYDTKNAIECAKRIIELRFRNYGEVEVED